MSEIFFIFKVDRSCTSKWLEDNHSIPRTISKWDKGRHKIYRKRLIGYKNMTILCI